MKTEQIYYQNPYQKELDATVVAIDGGRVVLNRTICYPEGGGQPGDRGMLGGSRILDTRKGEEGAILHVVDKVDCKVGDTVHVSLDWDHRYFYMQMHTAQHMISGILFAKHQIGTVAIHQGEEILTVETDQPAVGQEVCLQVEDEVNQAIREGHKVHYEEMTRREALDHHLRRSIKVGGDDIRLVVIDGVDEIACGGLHVADTREVALVQYVGQEMIRGHVRLIFRVARKAVEEIRHNRGVVEAMDALFSAQSENVVEVAQKAVAEMHELKAEVRRLSEEIAKADWAALPEGVSTIDITDKPYELKDLAGAIDGLKDTAVLAVKGERGGLRWLIACCGRYRDFDFASHRAELLGRIGGKGGGRAPLYQGSASCDKETFFSLFRTMMA